MTGQDAEQLPLSSLTEFFPHNNNNGDDDDKHLNSTFHPSGASVVLIQLANLIFPPFSP